jgi:hypothetical protein
MAGGQQTLAQVRRADTAYAQSGNSCPQSSSTRASSRVGHWSAEHGA